MYLKVKFAAGAAQEVGVREAIIRASPDLDITLKCLEEQTGFPVSEKVGKDYAVLVNGQTLNKLKKEGTSLKEDDAIMVVPYLGGG